MRLQDVMTDQVYKVSPDTTAETAWAIMSMRRIHHLVVTEDGRVVGLLSARDFGRIKGRRARERRTVGALMSLDVVTASPATTVRLAANIMRGRAIGCLVVVAGGRVVGIVTAADLLDLIDRDSGGPVPAPPRRRSRHVVHPVHHRGASQGVSSPSLRS
jgi:acetoin utilization protein AcuB